MLAALGSPILVRQREGAEVGLLRAKADGAVSADVALLLGAIVEFSDLLRSRVTFFG